MLECLVLELTLGRRACLIGLGGAIRQDNLRAGCVGSAALGSRHERDYLGRLRGMHDGRVVRMSASPGTLMRLQQTRLVCTVFSEEVRLRIVATDLLDGHDVSLGISALVYNWRVKRIIIVLYVFMIGCEARDVNSVFWLVAFLADDKHLVPRVRRRNRKRAILTQLLVNKLL